jgi:hypothetical protein
MKVHKIATQPVYPPNSRYLEIKEINKVSNTKVPDQYIQEY